MKSYLFSKNKIDNRRHPSIRIKRRACSGDRYEYDVLRINNGSNGLYVSGVNRRWYIFFAVNWRSSGLINPLPLWFNIIIQPISMNFTGMSVNILPSSPNWYCGGIVDVTDDGLVAYGARSDVNLLTIIKDKACQNGNEEPTPQTAQVRHSCRFISTISRCHKERVTFVKFRPNAQGSSSHNSGQSRLSYTLFSGGEDGKVKQLSISWETCEETELVSQFQTRTVSEIQLPRPVGDSPCYISLHVTW